jgi:hypothetical protein
MKKIKKQKKRKEIKSKRPRWLNLGFMAVVFLMMAAVSCSSVSNNRVEVRIEVNNPTAVDFAKYDKIFYKDVALEWTPEDFSPVQELKDFFLKELPKIIEKDIEPWEGQGPGAEAEMPANALLITGKLSLDIKQRSKIKEVKDETGKSKNVFAAIQHWDMTLSLEMKDSHSGSNIFTGEYREKLADVDTSDTTTKFNFETLFFKLTNRFLMKIKKTKKMQRRYLLL